MFFWKGCLSQSGDPQQRPAKKLPAAHPAGNYRRPNLYPRIAPAWPIRLLDVSNLNISRTIHRIFLSFCMKLKVSKG